MNHVQNVVSKLKAFDLDAMLITSEPNTFYTTDFHGAGICLITPEKAFFFTDPRYIEVAQRDIEGMTVDMPDQGYGYPITVGKLVHDLGIKRLGYEEEYMKVVEHRTYLEHVSCEMVKASALMRSLRQCKGEEEIDRLRRSQAITDAAFASILDYIKPGMTEQEISARLLFLHNCAGARTPLTPIAATGPNGSQPHAVPTTRQIQEGDFLTIDMGGIVDGYCSDMTRTIAMGKPTDEMRKVYDTVLEAQLAAIAAAKAGVPGCDIHNAAHDVIKKAGYGPYFTHSLGHGIGIEVHEKPYANLANTEPFPVGSVISAEPGIYLPGRFGVRIEDLIVLTEDGNINLTTSPKELIIL